MKVKVYQHTEFFLQWLAEWAERNRQRFAICPTCKANRYTGAPCVKY